LKNSLSRRAFESGFAAACRKISKKIPSKALAIFFDRLAIIMDFGEDLDESCMRNRAPF
jgi:archaellum biogenesis protein FlaJ (TadC family)